MRRTTLSLPDDVAEALTREAARRRTSASAVAREAIEHHLGLAGDAPRHVAFAAVGRSGRRTTARDLEIELREGWRAPTRDR